MKYSISFQVDKKSGYINTVDVELSEGVMDALDQARIDLMDHPLYAQLQEYVLNNPVPRLKSGA